uniref:MOSC domain-containing protein n=1 Tax=Steinernema glaseri TaxID=37863 RepID=A0A1I7YSU8_9BILA
MKSKAMESVSTLFIESVIRILDDGDRCDVEEIPGRWGKCGRASRKKTGSLEIAFAPNEQNEWRLHYQLDGWPHLKTKKLSRKVFGDIARNILSIEFFTTDKVLDEDWQSIGPDDKDGLVTFLTNLDAPEKKVEFEPATRLMNPDSDTLLMARHPQFLANFSSLEMISIDQAPAGLVQQMLSTGRLRSVVIRNPVPASALPSKAWVEYFLSESCMELRAEIKGFKTILELIAQWKKMDPRTLPPKKVFLASDCSVRDMAKLGKTKIAVESADKKILRVIGGAKEITRLHRIDHPVQPGSRIYVAFSLRPRARQSGDVVMVLD